jgi:hypothetical protein
MKRLQNKIKKLQLQIEKLEAKTKPLKKELKQAIYQMDIELWAKNTNYSGFAIWKKCYHHNLDKYNMDYIKLMVKKGADINYTDKFYGNQTALDCAIKNSDNKKKYIKELRKLGAKTSEELKNNNN